MSYCHTLARSWVLGLNLLLVAATLAGCLTPAPSAGDENDDEREEGTTEEGANETVPQPLSFNGTALILNPAHPLFCFEEGVDGDMHEIGKNVDDWHYWIDPVEAFAVYWYGDEYIEGGDDSGRVPTGSTHAQVCAVQTEGPTDYTLTLVHPDHPDA